MKNLFKTILPVIIVGALIGGISLGATLLYPSGGGTGIGSYGRGDLIIATSTNQLYKLATSTEGYVLTISSGIPAWAASGGAAAITINGVSGPTFTFATSSDTNIGLTIATSTGQLTFTPTWIGTLANARIASSTYWTEGVVPVYASSSNWNTAYSWGDHALAGYLTSYSETDPIWQASSTLYVDWANASTSNWDLAYGWNDHSLAGYLTSYTETDPVWNAASSSFVRWDAASTTNWDAGYSHSLLTSGNPHSVTKSDVGLGSVENTALSTWGGSTNLLTVGTIATGTWQGTVIADAYVANDITLTNITQITNRAISDTTGTLAYGRGGTGTSTALANQYLWWGDGSGGLVQVASSTLAGAGGVTSLNTFTGDLTIWGTTNQLTVTASSTVGLVLSLPQNIHTGASPTFAGLTLSGITSGFLKVNGSGLVSTSTIDISADTNLAAGRSLTMSGDSVEADAELYTDTKCIYWESPVAADDFKSIWRSSQAITFTKVWAESDQTVTFNLQEDDGSPANILSASLAPAATEASTTDFADANFAANSELDIVVDSVANTPTWISICFDYTKDD